MSRGLNKVMVIGNLGRDPEIRYLPTGKPVANLAIATSESWTDKNTGQKVETTEWHRVVLFNRLAEVAQQYVHKGSKVYIEGRLRTNKWQDKQGQERYTTEIIANDMQMLDSRSGNGTQEKMPEAGHKDVSNSYQSAAQTPPNQPVEQQAVIEEATPNELDDDILF